MYKTTFKNTIKILYCFLFVLVSIKVVAQDNANDPSKYVPNIIPPSPTAYALGTYGNTPIGLFTGSQNISVPIYTYKTANLEVPITMFYSSNGVKVDEISTNVGQSWNLSFGGVITRVVRDKPDEDRGSYPIPVSMPQDLGPTSPQALEFYQFIGENDVDSEADLFSFNFGKYSGKFVFDNDGTIVLMPAQEFQIHCTNSAEGLDFVVTAPDGVKYYFNDKEITTQRILGAGHSLPNIVVSSWYLSKIVHPKGDEIQFLYDDMTSTYVASQSQTFRMLSPRIQKDAAGNLENYSQDLSLICDHTINLKGKAIKTIKSTNAAYGEVLFSYLSATSADVTSGNNKIDQITVKDKASTEIDRIKFTYTTTTNNRVFLDKIQFKDIDKSYQFDYNSRASLPKRLSFSQDHWGYCNGKNNSCLVPKDEEIQPVTDYNGADKEPNESYAQVGLLKKITYPTKGYTIFDYESNKYYGEKKVYYNRIYGGLSAVVPDSLRSKTSTSRFTIDSAQKVSMVVGISIDPCGNEATDADKAKASISVYNNITKKSMTLYRSDNGYSIGTGYTFYDDNNFEAKKIYFQAAAGQDYTITLTANWMCTSAGVSYSYLPDGFTIVPTNIVTGGVRVARTSDYSVNKTAPIIKRFHYARKNSLEISTANKGADPYYLDTYRVDRILESPGAGIYGVPTSTTYLNLSSSSLVSLFDTGSSNVYYNYVTISYGDDNFLNGGEEHEFIVHRDAGDGYVFGNYPVRSVPLTNLGWNNGLERRVDYFNKNLKTVKEIINNYEEKSEFRKEVISYSARKQYEKIEKEPVNYLCTQADLTKTFDYKTCVANHKHILASNLVKNILGIKTESYECVAPGRQIVTTKITHPCFGATLPKTISNISNIDNLSIVSYKSIGFWHYLKSTEELVYDINGQNPVKTVTNYNYNAQNHLQLTSQASSSSVGENLESKYYYPSDLLTSNQGANMQKLVNQNRIDTPVKTEMLVNAAQTSENIVKYEESSATGNLLLPKEIHEMRGAGDIDITTTKDRKIVFSLLDNGNGNILEYKIENGTPVAIIWGYNKTKPIAKIENALYSEVSSYVANLQTKSDTDTEANLILALNNLRTVLPNAMITTYTYKPLIGISSVTDPKGLITYYEYDNFNRLKVVKDAKGNILSQNQYHYKTN